jgi:hypothetical protein
MSTEAVTTSEIEGELLDRASVQSWIRRQLGVANDKRNVRPAEQGIAEMMFDLYRSYAVPLSEETHFRWHQMVMSGRRDLVDIGRYRTSEEPMQVMSEANWWNCSEEPHSRARSPHFCFAANPSYVKVIGLGPGR